MKMTGMLPGHRQYILEGHLVQVEIAFLKSRHDAVSLACSVGNHRSIYTFKSNRR